MGLGWARKSERARKMARRDFASKLAMKKYLGLKKECLEYELRELYFQLEYLMPVKDNLSAFLTDSRFSNLLADTEENDTDYQWMQQAYNKIPIMLSNYHS